VTAGTARLLDALERAYPEATRADVGFVLVAATPLAEPLLPGLLALFPEAVFTVAGENAETLGSLHAVAEQAAGRLRTVHTGIGDLPDAAPGPYDLIVVRQPDVGQARAAWRYAFEACSGALAAGGLLVVSTDLLPDAGLIDDVLRALSLEMRPGSPYTPVPVAFSGEDRYIMLYGRE
jgi:hypothetical protein